MVLLCKLLAQLCRCIYILKSLSQRWRILKPLATRGWSLGWLWNRKLILGHWSSSARSIFIIFLVATFVKVVTLLHLLIHKWWLLLLIRHKIIILLRVSTLESHLINIFSRWWAHSLPATSSGCLRSIRLNMFLVIFLVPGTLLLLGRLIWRILSLLTILLLHNRGVAFEVHSSSLSISTVAVIAVSIRIEILIIIILHFAFSLLWPLLVKIWLSMSFFCLAIIAAAHWWTFVSHYNIN